MAKIANSVGKLPHLKQYKYNTLNLEDIIVPRDNDLSQCWRMGNNGYLSESAQKVQRYWQNLAEATPECAVQGRCYMYYGNLDGDTPYLPDGNGNGYYYECVKEHIICCMQDASGKVTRFIFKGDQWQIFGGSRCLPPSLRELRALKIIASGNSFIELLNGLNDYVNAYIKNGDRMTCIIILTVDNFLSAMTPFCDHELSSKIDKIRSDAINGDAERFIKECVVQLNSN